jgi:hypothetical protein
MKFHLVSSCLGPKSFASRNYCSYLGSVVKLCVAVPNVAAPFSLLGVVRTIKELRHQPQQLQSQQQQQQHRQEQQILAEKLFSHNFVLFSIQKKCSNHS